MIDLVKTAQKLRRCASIEHHLGDALSRLPSSMVNISIRTYLEELFMILIKHMVLLEKQTEFL
jgi:hypothetical protein